MRSDGRSSILVRLDCENLDFDVVDEDDDLQCSSKAIPNDRVDTLTVLLTARYFSGRASQKDKEILFHFDSLHSVAVSTRYVELIQKRTLSDNLEFTEARTILRCPPEST